MKKTHIIGLVILAVAMVVIIISLKDSSNYVGFKHAEAYPNHEYHVIGELVEDKPMKYKPRKNPNHFTFYMKDKKGNKKKVVYHDAKPNDFERSDRIVIVGQMKNEQTFEANKILMKCPSKYKNENVVKTSKETATSSNEL